MGWYSSESEDRGFRKPPFTYWLTGRVVDLGCFGESDAPEVFTFVAVIDAPSATEAWDAIIRHFPDASERFVVPKKPGFMPPSDRFHSSSPIKTIWRE